MCVFVCLQTFSITDSAVQRREIDSICLFFVMVGVVSFFTQMLQVASALTRLIASALLPLPAPVFQERGKVTGDLLYSAKLVLGRHKIYPHPAEMLFCN